MNASTVSNNSLSYSQDNLDKKSTNQSVNQYELDDTFKSYKFNSNTSLKYESEKEVENLKPENIKSASATELENQKFESSNTGSFKLDNSDISSKAESLSKVSSDASKSDSIKPTEGSISSTYILKPESIKLSDSMKSTGSNKCEIIIKPEINKSETFKLASSSKSDSNRSLENIKSSSSNKSDSMKSSNSIKSINKSYKYLSSRGETKVMAANTKPESPVLSKQRTFSTEDAIKDYIYSTVDKLLAEQEPVKMSNNANIMTNVSVDLDQTNDQTVDLTEKELIEQKIREEEEREHRLQNETITSDQQIIKKQKIITSTPYPSITEYNISNKILEQLNSEQTSEIEKSLLQEKIKQELLKVQSYGQVADDTLPLTKSVTESAVNTAAHETDNDISLTEKEMYDRSSVGDASFEDQKSTASLEAAVDFLVEKLVKIVRDGSYE
jgi:hypothetical protein